MCDPVTLAGIALTGLSTGLNYMANQQVESARDSAMAAERIRQQGLDQQADALNLQSQDRFQGFEDKKDERSSQLGQYFTDQVATPPTAAAMPASGSNITVQAENKARGDARERTDQIGNALGELRSFGDLLGDTSRLQARDASQIGQIGGFKRGSSNILGMELDSANSAGSGMRLGADIAGGLGKIGVNAGLSGTGSLGNLFGGGGNTVASAGAAGSRALGGALDRASVPGYAGYSAPNMFNIFGSR
jgi:hypothetical protein